MSVRFGVGAIIVSLLIPLGIFILIISYQALKSGNVELLGARAAIFGMIVGVVMPLIALIRGTVFAIIQLRLNRRTISWIALIIFLIAFAGRLLLITTELL